MCYDDRARPPYPPIIAGGAADAGDLMLKAGDGADVMAYHARASNPNGAGMVILPDVRGLHQFYKDLADRFAEAGVHAIAVDYFARTAGPGARDESFEFRPHVEQTKPEWVDLDAAAGAEYLRSAEGGSAERIFTVGFCWGGSNSWRQSASLEGLSGAVGFYGVPSRAEDAIPNMKAPLLIFAAGQDFTPVEATQEFAQKVRDNGVEATVQVYPDAPHSFFDRTFDEHKEACDDAWRQILTLVA